MTGDPTTIAPPVFVLCSARSGSTLLRFILDAHPDLACPPETNIPALCAQLSSFWSLVEGGPLAADRGEVPPQIPDAAITGIRRTVDLMISSYLARRDAKRFCDKSLGTARFANLLTRVYPEAKFLCLYRHPMDMISSGIEASPWGVAGYGFDPYIAASPGNIVLALARYWNDNTAEIRAVEERLADACHRVRYEDLTTDPERTAEEVFGFLGVAPAPGITKQCFTAERERTGPADFKIWHTSQISASSIGRGWTIPAARIPPEILAQTNDLAAQLGYVQVDSGWGTTAVPPDLRTDVEPAAQANGHAARKLDGPGATLLQQLLMTAIIRLDDGFAGRWGKRADDAFGVVVSPAAGGGHLRWRIDPAARSVTRPADDEDDGTQWNVLGSDRAWEAVLDGSLNIGVALRARELRYSDAGEEDLPVTAESRIDLLTDFLGLAAWPVTAIAREGAG